MDKSSKQSRHKQASGGRRQFMGGKPNKPTGPGAKAPKSTGSGGTQRPSAPPNRRTVPRPASPRPTNQPTVQRVKPEVRAANREVKNVSRPMPQPPVRRPIARAAVTGAATAATVRALSEEQKAEAIGIESQFEGLEKQAQLSAIYEDIGKFDSKLVEYPLTVDKLRSRGYVHSGQLEDQIEALDDKWDQVRPRVEMALQQQVQHLNRGLDEAERRVNQMNNAAGVKGAETAVNSLASQISAAERAVNSLYQGLETELDTIGYRLNNLSQMLDLYAGSPEIRLYEAEGPLMAVAAEWKQDGDEGPDGYLFLTDQRLLFEQREEVVTKRKFGIFKSESEKIQKVLIEVQTHEIAEVVHKEEGGFLGMGKADILELVFADTASLTRARFHLKGQNSSDWAAMIKRVQTGEINADRADDYLEEVKTAETVTTSFPTQCPTCFAATELPPRGATSLTCGFCGTVITPQVS